MSKHTAGQWYTHLHGKSLPGAVETTKQVICRIDQEDYNPEDREQIRANARLIAAAPEMLEALQAAYDKFSKFNFIWEGRETVDGQWLLARMKSALAKATGEKEKVI